MIITAAYANGQHIAPKDITEQTRGGIKMSIRTIEDGFQWNIKQALASLFADYQSDLARDRTTLGFEDWIYDREQRIRDAGVALLKQARQHTFLNTLYDED